MCKGNKLSLEDQTKRVVADDPATPTHENRAGKKKRQR